MIWSSGHPNPNLRSLAASSARPAVALPLLNQLDSQRPNIKRCSTGYLAVIYLSDKCGVDGGIHRAARTAAGTVEPDFGKPVHVHRLLAGDASPVHQRHGHGARVAGSVRERGARGVRT